MASTTTTTTTRMINTHHDPEFTAVILGATCGARLFPITFSGDEQDAFGAAAGDNGNDDDDSTTEVDANTDTKTATAATSTNKYMPKHLLPLAGRPILYHLLLHMKTIGFELCVVALNANDCVTIPAIIAEMTSNITATTTPQQSPSQSIHETTSSNGTIHTIVWGGTTTIVVVKLPSECGGSADALRHLSTLTHEPMTTTEAADDTTSTDPANPILPPSSHIMILPADLILYGHLNNTNEDEDDDALSSLADAHRMGCQTNNHHNNNHNHPNNSSSIQSDYNNNENSNNNSHPQQTDNNNLPKKSPPSAITMLLTDVSEYDDNGHPLKESAKAKKGGVARDDDEIDYIALSSAPSIRSSSSTPSTAPTSSPSSRSNHHRSTTRQPPVVARLLLKQSKYSVEEDVENTASTPKLTIPKALFKYNQSNSNNAMMIRTEWSDVHVFCMSPWVVKLLQARPGVKDLAKELIPLLVKRQFRGVRSTFGGRRGKGVDNSSTSASEALGVSVVGTEQKEEEARRMELLEGVLGSAPFFATTGGGKQQTTDYPYVVAAKVVSRAMSKLTIRACTIPTYLYGCRETILHATATTASSSSTTTAGANMSTPTSMSIPIPENTTLDSKFNTLRLSSSSTTTNTKSDGDKVQIKSSTIGRNCQFGSKCRLNNVVVMDDVTVGDNCVLQNLVLAKGCTVGDNCNLKECQVGAGVVVGDGSKATGECFFDG